MNLQTHPRRSRARNALGQLFFAAAFVLAVSPEQSWACACGCGVFEVGAGSIRPAGKGGTAFLEYDFSNQSHNWSGASKAPAADNPDKQIRTDFYTAGAQYMFDRSWGVMAQLPVWDRRLRTDDGAGVIDTSDHASIGDVRLMGVYSGFSPDMSSGVILGVKLPTGDFKYANFDRDTEIGSGSTDLLLGAYHQGHLCNTGKFAYFVQGLWDKPLAYQGGYDPGQEFDGAFGLYYTGALIDGDKITIAPVLQLITSTRARDTGPKANNGDSGYARLLISPGLELSTETWKLYGDVEFRVYQHVNGNQLVAPELFKVVLSRSF